MWRRVGKILGQIGIGIVILLVLSMVPEAINPAGFDYWSAARARALMRAGVRPSHLPAKVEFTIDGVHTVFRRDEQSFRQLVKLLRHGNTQKMLDEDWKLYKVGYGGSADYCGEMVIRTFGYPTHFELVRFNDRIYTIWSPSMIYYPGRRESLFTADPRVIEFIKSHSER